MKFLPIFEEIENKQTPIHNASYLYHVTNIKNLDDIEKHGLLPQFGETLQGAYGSEYDFNNEYGEDDYDVPVKVPVPGVLFFSEVPALKYSQFFSNNFDWNQVLLCIVKKNDTIFHKIDYERVEDNDGNIVRSIRFNRWDYINVYDLPIFIESEDWFSFDEQDVEYILFGEALKLFINTNFPNLKINQ